MLTPIAPEMKKRSARAVKGGAYSTITRAEVKADDHINANAKPITIALISMFRLNAKGPPVWATLSESLCDFKSLERLVVHGILKRFRDCHFDNLVSVFLEASFLICSPVAGLRTIRSGRSRQ